MGPEDYKCKECGNFVLYRSDHEPSCMHYPRPLYFVGVN